MSEYQEKMKDPRWQAKRILILKRDNYTCQMRGEINKELHVHHTQYFSYLEPWDYPDLFLVTFCKDCHLLVTLNENDSEVIGFRFLRAVRFMKDNIHG